MGKNLNRKNNQNETPDFLKEISFRTEKTKYGIDVPLDDSLDNIMADWSPGWTEQNNATEGEGFTQGDGCEWEDVRTVEFEVHIDRWTRETLFSDLATILNRMYKEVRDDINSRACVKPCHTDGLTYEKLNSGAYYQRRPKMRPYSEGEKPHDWRLYDHYWHLVYTITYKYTKKCSR